MRAIVVVHNLQHTPIELPQPLAVSTRQLWRFATEAEAKSWFVPTVLAYSSPTPELDTGRSTGGEEIDGGYMADTDVDNMKEYGGSKIDEQNKTPIWQFHQKVVYLFVVSNPGYLWLTASKYCQSMVNGMLHEGCP